MKRRSIYKPSNSQPSSESSTHNTNSSSGRKSTTSNPISKYSVNQDIAKDSSSCQEPTKLNSECNIIVISNNYSSSKEILDFKSGNSTLNESSIPEVSSKVYSDDITDQNRIDSTLTISGNKPGNFTPNRDPPPSSKSVTLNNSKIPHSHNSPCGSVDNKVNSQKKNISANNPTSGSPTGSNFGTGINKQEESTISTKKIAPVAPFTSDQKILQKRSNFISSLPFTASPGNSKITVYGHLLERSAVAPADRPNQSKEENESTTSKPNEASSSGSHVTNLSNQEHGAIMSSSKSKVASCGSSNMTIKNSHQNSINILDKGSKAASPSGSNMTRLNSQQHSSTATDRKPKVANCGGIVSSAKKPKRASSNSSHVARPSKQQCDTSFSDSKPKVASCEGSIMTILSNEQYETVISGKSKLASLSGSNRTNVSNQQHSPTISGYKPRVAIDSIVTNLSIQQHGTTISDIKPRAKNHIAKCSNISNSSNLNQGITVYDNEHSATDNIHLDTMTSNANMGMSSAPLRHLAQNFSVSNNPSFVANLPSCNPSRTKPICPNQLSDNLPVEPKQTTIQKIVEHTIKIKNSIVSEVKEGIRGLKKLKSLPTFPATDIKCDQSNPPRTKWSCPNFGSSNKTPVKIDQKWPLMTKLKVLTRKGKQALECKLQKSIEMIKSSISAIELKHDAPKIKWSCPGAGPCNARRQLNSKLTTIIIYLKKLKKTIVRGIHKWLKNNKLPASHDTIPPKPKTRWKCPVAGSCNEPPIIIVELTRKQIILARLKKFKNFILRRVRRAYRRGKIINKSICDSIGQYLPKIRQWLKYFRGLLRRIKLSKLKEPMAGDRRIAIMLRIQDKVNNVMISIQEKVSKVKTMMFQNRLEKPSASGSPPAARSPTSAAVPPTPVDKPALPVTISSPPVTESPLPVAMPPSPAAEPPLLAAITPSPAATLPPPIATLPQPAAAISLNAASLSVIPESAEITGPEAVEVHPTRAIPPKKPNLKTKIQDMIKQLKLQKETPEPEPEVDLEPEPKPEPAKIGKDPEVKREKKSTLYEGYRSEQFIRDREWFKNEYLRHVGSPQKELRSEYGLEKSVLDELKGQRVQAMAEVLMYKKPVLHGPHLVNVDFRTTPLATRCVCPERNCTCYLKRSALSYRKSFMPYAIPTHCIKKIIICLIPCLARDNKRSLVPKLLNKHAQERDFYRSPKGLKMLKLGGPQFCLSGCMGYFLAGRTFQRLSFFAGPAAKVVYPKTRRRQKSAPPPEPIDTEVTICSYYHCTVSTQTTFSPKGDLIYGEIVGTMYAAIGEGIFKDLSGTRLEVSAYKQEPPAILCPVNINNNLQYNIIKERLSKWKCGLYTSIRKSGVCLKEGISRNLIVPEDSSPFSTTFKNFEDTSKALQPCRSPGKSKLKKSSVSFGNCIDKENVGSGRNRGITIKEIIGDGEDYNVYKTVSSSTDGDVNSCANIEKGHDVITDIGNQPTTLLKLEEKSKDEIKQKVECLSPLIRLSKIKDDVLKWIFQPEPEFTLEPMGYEYSLSLCKDICKTAGEDKESDVEEVSSTHSCTLIVAENQKVVTSDSPEPSPLVADRKEDAIKTSIQETTPVVQTPTQNVDVPVVLPKPADFSNENIISNEEYRSLCKPRKDGTCGPAAKGIPFCRIICPHCESFKLDTSIYETASIKKHDGIVTSNSHLTAPIITVENKQEYVIINNDTQKSVPSVSAETKHVITQTNVGEKAQSNIKAVKDIEITKPQKPSKVKANSSPLLEKNKCNDEYKSLCKPWSDGICGPLIIEKPLSKTVCPRCESYKIDTSLYETAPAINNDSNVNTPNNIAIMSVVSVESKQEYQIKSDTQDYMPPNTPEKQKEYYLITDIKDINQTNDINKDLLFEASVLSSELCAGEMICPDCKSYKLDTGHYAPENFDENTRNTLKKATLETETSVNKTKETLNSSDANVCGYNNQPESKEKTEFHENKDMNEPRPNATYEKKTKAGQESLIEPSDLNCNLCETESVLLKANEQKPESRPKNPPITLSPKSVPKNYCRYDDNEGLTLVTFNEKHKTVGSPSDTEATPTSKDKESELIINKLWNVDNNELKQSQCSVKKWTLTDMLKKLKAKSIKIDAKTSVHSKNSNKPSEVMIEKTSYENYEEIMDKESKTRDIITMTSVEQVEVKRSKELEERGEDKSVEHVGNNINYHRMEKDNTETVIVKESDPTKSQKPEMSRYRYYF